MKTIILDVSTNLMYIGLVDNNKFVDFETRVAKNDHAKYVIDRLDQLLKRNDCTINDIKKIVVGIGPGSYTGIRIAVMVAKMLGYTKNIEVETISSLLLLTSGYNGLTLAMIDARRGQVFSGAYFNGETKLEEKLRLLSELETKSIYKEATNVLINEDTYKINVDVVLKHTTKVEDIHLLVPNYLRRTEAEMNYDKTSQRT
ncbi:MAG TPA: tRNA (adenosine(37)-N6)-threonylcarbamoyltransferase complex dimerization subunit type 1 TsaB [Acholeplasma sp.]|jgi:tRNA threonylcarbamoyladenosine biosynthesis protein TsaB|nr:tRNA (adenosine(37)-N6)-threonylcarbamoyltransferase complex dimerization subunit type 1 TsaB [Acholeplasma sp.]